MEGVRGELGARRGASLRPSRSLAPRRAGCQPVRAESPACADWSCAPGTRRPVRRLVWSGLSGRGLGGVCGACTVSGQSARLGVADPARVAVVGRARGFRGVVGDLELPGGCQTVAGEMRKGVGNPVDLRNGGCRGGVALEGVRGDHRLGDGAWIGGVAGIGPAVLYSGVSPLYFSRAKRGQGRQRAWPCVVFGPVRTRARKGGFRGVSPPPCSQALLRAKGPAPLRA